MRWFDLYMGLMAATMGFGAVVAWTAGMPPAGIGAFGVGAGGFLVIMALRAAHTPKVVLVGDPDPSFDLQEALDRDGFAVCSCVGPARRPCPVLEGWECPVRGHPVAAIVRIPVAYGGPAAPCGTALGVPMLEVHEVTDEELASGTYEHLSEIGQPEDVVAAMDRALSA